MYAQHSLETRERERERVGGYNTTARKLQSCKKLACNDIPSPPALRAPKKSKKRGKGQTPDAQEQVNSKTKQRKGCGLVSIA
jgi:hypothetical protein